MAQLGRIHDGKGTGIEVDIDRFIETRMLIQANSGGGKSFLLRKFLEVTHGKVQQIVLDMEGEFGTLREKYDYILAGKGGDISADPRHAGILAHKILELGTSLIVDLYELKSHDRQIFVKEFLEALINAPKDLWHPAMIVIDEAHVFAPEKGKAEAMSAVIDLATRGRKRGFALVAATQRLSKFHKDVAAECINKLVGRTNLDIDMKRAAEELGFTTKAEMLALRDLEPGDFYAYGPALTGHVEKIHINPVQTTHPKAGQRLKLKVPEPTSKVKHILQKLTDLPKEAEEELKDRRQMTSKIKELEHQLRAHSRELISKDDLKKIQSKIEETVKREYVKEVARVLTKNYTVFKKSVDEEFEAFKSETIHEVNKLSPVPVTPSASPTTHIAPPKIAQVTVHKKEPTVEVDGKTFGRCEKAILKFLALRAHNTFTKVQVGAITNYAHDSGSFGNAVSKLHSAGLIYKQGDNLRVNELAMDKIQEILGDEFQYEDKNSLENWLTKLGKAERRIYETLLVNPDNSYDKHALGAAVGYEPTSGSFGNALSRLCTLGLAVRTGDGLIKLNDQIRGLQ